MWGVDKMKIRWTNQAEEQQAEVFFEKGRATPENFRKLGKKRGGDCRIVVKKEGFSEEEWIQMPADLPAGERIRQKTVGFRICPGRKQDCGFITGQPDTSTVAMRHSIWGRCTCIPRTIKEWQKQQNFRYDPRVCENSWNTTTGVDWSLMTGKIYREKNWTGETGGDTTRSPGLPTSRRKAGIIFWNIPTSRLKSTIPMHISNCRSAG